jgi:hypothetical protein
MNVDFTTGAIGTIQATRTAAGQFDQLRLRCLRRNRLDRDDLRHRQIDLARLPWRRRATPAPGATSPSIRSKRTISASSRPCGPGRPRNRRSVGRQTSRKSSTRHSPPISATSDEELIYLKVRLAEAGTPSCRCRRRQQVSRNGSRAAPRAMPPPLKLAGFIGEIQGVRNGRVDVSRRSIDS